MSADAHRRVEERGADQQHHEPETRVVVSTERLHSLEPASARFSLVGVIRQGSAFRGLEPRGVDRLEQRATRGADILHGSERAGGRRGGSDGQRPAEDRHGGGDRAETDQDEENSLAEGEAHRL